MSRYYSKGRECSGLCGRAITWSTPAGRFVEHDDQFRCPKCSQAGRTPDPEFVAKYEAQDKVIEAIRAGTY